MSSENGGGSHPLVDGLNAGERIEIGYEAGISILIFLRKGFGPMLLLIVGAGIMGSLPLGSQAGMLLIIVIFNIAAIAGFLFLLAYVVFMFIQVKRTKYFITNTRLVEVHGKKIVREISKINLQNLETAEYLKSTFAQKHGTQYSYNITVTDKITGTIILMTSLSGGIEETIERWVNEGKRKTRPKSSS